MSVITQSDGLFSDKSDSSETEATEAVTLESIPTIKDVLKSYEGHIPEPAARGLEFIMSVKLTDDLTTVRGALKTLDCIAKTTLEKHLDAQLALFLAYQRHTPHTAVELAWWELRVKGLLTRFIQRAAAFRRPGTLQKEHVMWENGFHAIYLTSRPKEATNPDDLPDSGSASTDGSAEESKSSLEDTTDNSLSSDSKPSDDDILSNALLTSGEYDQLKTFLVDPLVETFNNSVASHRERLDFTLGDSCTTLKDARRTLSGKLSELHDYTADDQQLYLAMLTRAMDLEALIHRGHPLKKHFDNERSLALFLITPFDKTLTSIKGGLAGQFEWRVEDSGARIAAEKKVEAVKETSDKETSAKKTNKRGKQGKQADHHIVTKCDGRRFAILLREDGAITDHDDSSTDESVIGDSKVKVLQDRWKITRLAVDCLEHEQTAVSGRYILLLRTYELTVVAEMMVVVCGVPTVVPIFRHSLLPSDGARRTDVLQAALDDVTALEMLKRSVELAYKMRALKDLAVKQVELLHAAVRSGSGAGAGAGAGASSPATTSSSSSSSSCSSSKPATSLLPSSPPQDQVVSDADAIKSDADMETGANKAWVCFVCHTPHDTVEAMSTHACDSSRDVHGEDHPQDFWSRYMRRLGHEMAPLSTHSPNSTFSAKPPGPKSKTNPSSTSAHSNLPTLSNPSLLSPRHHAAIYANTLIYTVTVTRPHLSSSSASSFSSSASFSFPDAPSFPAVAKIFIDDAVDLDDFQRESKIHHFVSRARVRNVVPLIHSYTNSVTTVHFRPGRCLLLPLLRRVEVEEYATMTARQLRGLGLSLCSAVADLHNYGIAHLDISPSNVYHCDDDGESFLLADFGHSHWTYMEEGWPVGFGTRGYCAPEGRDEYDGQCGSFRSDDYSVAAVLAEALCHGFLDYKGDAENCVERLREEVSSCRYEPRSECDAVPRAVLTYIGGLLDRRRGDVAGLAAVLEAWDVSEEKAPKAVVVTASDATTRGRKRRVSKTVYQSTRPPLGDIHRNRSLVMLSSAPKL